jgi:hypothetical protein
VDSLGEKLVFGCDDRVESVSLWEDVRYEVDG